MLRKSKPGTIAHRTDVHELLGAHIVRTEQVCLVIRVQELEELGLVLQGIGNVVTCTPRLQQALQTIFDSVMLPNSGDRQCAPALSSRDP